jgi:hypothetical protein
MVRLPLSGLLYLTELRDEDKFVPVGAMINGVKQ